MIPPWILLLSSLAFGLAGAWAVSRWGRVLGWIDLPTERSSHHRATPKGGGIGIAAGVWFSAVWAGMPFLFWAPVVAISLLGLAADRFEVAPGPRLLVEFALAGLLLWAMDLSFRGVSPYAVVALLAEGLRPETVIKTGSPMGEVLDFYRAKIEASDVLTHLGLSQGRYVVVSAHREENIDDGAHFSSLLETLNALAGRFEFPIIVSTHPRTRQRLSTNPVAMDPRLVFLKPLGFFDYVHLQQHAFCTVSDSGTITEESSILSFPAVTIRQAHERPEGMDEAAVVMCGLKPGRVIEAVELVTAQAQRDRKVFKAVQDYQADNVSVKVVRIILSYIDYVQRTVWFRQ